MDNFANVVDIVIRLSWRSLAVRLSGPEDGYPVFLMHGTPGSRLSVLMSDDQLTELGVRLISYDRPGYGRSTAVPGRSVAQAADDVRAIADALGVEQFSVIGRSGGGPHALAAAALLPHRVHRVASLVGLAPSGMPDLNWLDGMEAGNRAEYSAAMAGRRQLLKHLFPEVMALRSDPFRFAVRLFAHSPSSDRRMIGTPGWQKLLVAGLVEGVEASLDGWAADTLAFTRPWGFEPSLIRVPTLIWHGLRDVFSPVAHAHWLARRIHDAELVLSENSSHLHAAAAQHDSLRWLVEGGQPHMGLQQELCG